MTGSHEVRGSIPLGSTNTCNSLGPPFGGPYRFVCQLQNHRSWPKRFRRLRWRFTVRYQTTVRNGKNDFRNAAHCPEIFRFSRLKDILPHSFFRTA